MSSKVEFNANNCLFFSDKEMYKQVEKVAIKLRSIFAISSATLLPTIIKEYASQNNVIVKILHLPLKDNQLWGIFYNINGIYFIVINSEISQNKQMVALAHEFYHFYASIEENLEPRDILNADTQELNIEDKKANTFAACLLIPEDYLKVLCNTEDTIIGKINQIKKVMNIFMVPYKTAVIRLAETGFFSEKEALEFINMINKETRDIFDVVSMNNIKWNFADNSIDLDDYETLIHSNEDLGLMSSKKLNKQKEIVKNILDHFGDKNN